MIALRRNQERRHVKRGKQEIRLTLYPTKRSGSLTADFGLLAAFDEIRLKPGGVCALRPLKGTEILTYVFKGALSQEDSNGHSGVVHAGEFQRMTIGLGNSHKERNALQDDSTRFFRISLRSSEPEVDSTREKKRFAMGQRHNLLCVIASPDGRKKSLHILQDALVCSSILDPGRHLVHELLPGRSAWLHVIHGEAIFQNIILSQGDGVGVSREASVSFTAQENTEILLVDLGPSSGAFRSLA